MELKVKIRNIYGNKTIYPICEKSKLLAKFKKQKTLTDDDVTLLKELGYTFTVESDQL